MKHTSIIIIVLLQALFSLGQVVDFKQMSIDFSKLDNENEYRESKEDSAYIPSVDDYLLSTYGKSVFASSNHEYFLVENDTTADGYLRRTFGCDIPTETDYKYYHKDTLLWKKHMSNRIQGVHFFENDGSVIIKWNCVWAGDNNNLFYNRQGNVFDTLSIDEEIYDLDNNLKLLRYSVEPIEGKYGFDRIRCIDSKFRELWEDGVILDKDEYRFLNVSHRGTSFTIQTRDSTWVYNSEHNLLWKKCRGEFIGHEYYIGNGDYMVGKKYKPINEKTRREEPELYIYDSKTGNLVKRIDSIFYGDSCLISLSPISVRNSEYIYYENIFWDINKCDIVITDLMGKVILFKSLELNNRPTRIEYYKGFNLYHNENLIETIKY